MQPAAAGRRATGQAAAAVGLAGAAVEPDYITHARFVTWSATPGRASSALMASGLPGAVLGSNQGNIWSTKSLLS